MRNTGQFAVSPLKSVRYFFSTLFSSLCRNMLVEKQQKTPFVCTIPTLHTFTVRTTRNELYLFFRAFCVFSSDCVFHYVLRVIWLRYNRYVYVQFSHLYTLFKDILTQFAITSTYNIVYIREPFSTKQPYSYVVFHQIYTFITNDRLGEAEDIVLTSCRWHSMPPILPNYHNLFRYSLIII